MHFDKKKCRGITNRDGKMNGREEGYIHIHARFCCEIDRSASLQVSISFCFLSRVCRSNNMATDVVHQNKSPPLGFSIQSPR